MALQVVTANRLKDGEVVYLTKTGTWTPWLPEAAASGDQDELAARMDVAAQAVTARQVVEPYLMPIAEDANGRRALSQRERIRAHGPTVRRDLGKQAGRPPVEGRHDV